MAAVRPIVLVYQDFAAVSVPVSLPSLNVCLVGPAYQIMDYATDKASIYVSDVGVVSTTPTGSAFAGTSLSSTAVPGRLAGATVDNASVKLYVDAGYAELVARADGAFAADNSLLTSAGSDFVTAGVAAGDRVVITVAAGIHVAKTVLSVVSATQLRLSTNFTTAGTRVDGTAYSGATLVTSAANFRVERPVSGALVTSTVTATANNVSAASPMTVAVGASNKNVTYGKVYAGYRALRSDLADLKQLDSTADILSKVGRVDERNPLAVAASIARANSSKSVQVYGVTGDNLNGASDLVTAHGLAIDALTGRKDVYAIVPLTNDINVITAWKNSVVSLAAPEIAKFRIVIGSSTLPTVKQIAPVSGTASGTAEAGTTAKPLLDNTATFLTSGVIVGDNVVIAGTRYPITAIESNNRLTMSGTGSLTAGAVTYYIERTLSKTDQVTALNAVAAGVAHSRCVMVWPDSCKLAGVTNALTGTASTQSGMYLAAAVGGMVSGLPTHQGLTFIGVAGIADMSNSNTYFNDTQIDALSNGGWYVLVQDVPQATPYSIHALTSDTTTLESGELMVVKNFDYVSMTYRNAIVGFLGKYNVIPETKDFIRSAFNSVTSTLKLQRFPNIGAPLLDATIDSLDVLAGSKDRLELYATVSIPRALNRIGLHLKA